MVDRRTGHGRGAKGANAGGSGVSNLVGSGPSIVGPVGAMRARDVARPDEEALARAEKTVVLRRRPADQPLPAVTLRQSSDGESAPADS